MKKLYAIVVVIMFSLFLLAGQAGAMIITLDDPMSTGSWDQRFRVTSDHTFNSLDAHMTTSGHSFKDEGSRNFSESDWHGSLVTFEHITASGGDTNNLDCNFHFDGDLHQKIDFILTAFHDNDEIDSIHAHYDGSGSRDGWDFEDCGKPRSVPEPATLLLFGAGLAGLGAMRIKIRV